MNKLNDIILEAVADFLCQKEDGSFFSPSEKVKKGRRITLIVPSIITETTIFNQTDISEYLDGIIDQFHKEGINISKSQLARSYWKVVGRPIPHIEKT